MLVLGKQHKNYNVYNKDRTCDIMDRGGDVMIIRIHKSLSTKLVKIDVMNLLDPLFVIVNVDSQKFVIGVIYIPPRSDIGVYNHHILQCKLIALQCTL